MDNKRNEQHDQKEIRVTLDASGIWFSAVSLFAVLTAGLIVYHTATSDIRATSNDAAGSLVSSLR
jgi:hypothetical protein